MMTIAQPANRLLLGFLLSTLVLLTACGVGNRPLLTDSSDAEASDLFAIGSRLYDTPNETRENQEPTDLVHKFLNVNDNRISTEGFTAFNVPATVCTFDGCVAQANAGTTGNGYAYYIAEDEDGNASNSYAGILASTNLGEPLRSFASPVATWRGEWSLNGAGPDTTDEADDLLMRIDFRTRQFAASGRKIIDGVRHDLVIAGTSQQPIYYTESGVMMNGRVSLERSNIVYNGFLIGLVGSEGAVGAFRSSDPGVSFAGGFVVSPPKRSP